MNISQMLKESLTVSKSNPLIFVPMLAASVFSAVLSLVLVGSALPMAKQFGAQAAEAPEQAVAGAGAAAGGFLVVSILSGIVGLLAHGMTVAMADQALDGSSATLATGWSRLTSRLVAILIASVLIGILVSVGMMLLVLPGLIVAFLLMFTLVAVMVDGAGAFDSLVRSFRTVTGNFRATFVVFLVLIALGVLAGLVSIILGLIPVLGVILTMVVSALYTGYVTIFIVRAYRELHTEPDSTPDART
ncbi:MAG: hypothetical protein ACLFUX_02415 [Spirochaetaceae bacterium]